MAKIIGIDTALFIYLLEENHVYLKRVEHIFKDIEEGKSEAVFSSIGIIEILTGPKKKGRYDLAGQYREIITHFPHLTIVGMNEHIVEIASDLRAKYTLPTPDAIHIATAMDFGADSFVTNDKKLRRVKEISIEVL